MPANKKNNSASFFQYFSILEDPRIDRNKLHNLNDIIMIGILATIAGAAGWGEMEIFAKSREKWLRLFLDLPNGIPSHDTIGRVFSLINMKQFQTCFIRWTDNIREVFSKEHIAIDGKCLRRSFINAEKGDPIHMVSAWGESNRLVLGQVKVDEKSNEITAIPKLLRSLWVRDCIITIDAMGCQKSIASDIIEAKADYLLAVKENQPSLHNEIKNHFEKKADEDKSQKNIFRTEESGHGRKEIREYEVISDIDWLSNRDQWRGIKAVGAAYSIRQTGKKETLNVRYYIMSDTLSAKKFGKTVRNHWGIENKLHWVLDVAFREDDCRIRDKNGPANMAVLRHMALNLLRKETTFKRGIKAKQFKASLDEEYFEKILNIR